MKIMNTALSLLICIVMILHADEDITLSGKVMKKGGGPLEGVTISLVNIGKLTASTDSNGKFSLSTVGTIQMKSPSVRPLELTLRGRDLLLPAGAGRLNGNVSVFSGEGRCRASIDFNDFQPSTHQITLPEFGPGLNLVHVTLNGHSFTCRVIKLKNEIYVKNGRMTSLSTGGFSVARMDASTAVDTIIAEKEGYKDARSPVSSYTDSNIVIEMDSSTGECEVPPLPEFDELEEIAELPDPFRMMNGERITTKAQWKCRREEIKALAQKWIYGWNPGEPDKMEAGYSGGKLTINCTVGSRSGEFSVDISGNSGNGPYPAIIAVAGFATYGAPSGVASIKYNEQQLAKSDVNGRDPAAGLFYDLYPEYKTTGSLMAWAWGISRVIDALEQEDIRAAAKIDPGRIGVTGCSFAGKAAFAIGVWEERIALTLPVESGAGGVSAWRIAEEYAPPGKPQYPASGAQDGCQYLYETYDESTWLGDSINLFRGEEFKLPIDMHEVGALLAPRGFLGLGYSTKWICAEGEWGTAIGMHMVYDALGYPDNMGMLIGHTASHCSKGSGLSEQQVYNIFVEKFLKGDTSADTSPDVGLKNDKGWPLSDQKYIPWSQPELSGEYPGPVYE